MYTIDYFINKFEAIPEEKWLTGIYGYPSDGIHCALGHCMDWKKEHSNMIFGNEAMTLRNILYNVMSINDGYKSAYLQPTPKQRVLAALYDKKGEQLVEIAKEIIKEEQLELV